MPKEPLYPHVPKKKEVRFPHEPKGRGEQLPATKKVGSFIIAHDYMGNLIITHTERTGEIFLQFESDRQTVYDILKKWELKEVEKGWSVQIKDTEPRASILAELWESSAKTQSLPQTTKKPTRDDVTVQSWQERDRLGIWLTDNRTDKTFAEWWDDEARQMFEDGFFKPGVPRYATEKPGRGFVESVLDYAESVGLLAGGKYLPQTSELSASTINLLAKTEGDPIRKFCCRQCGKCVPKDLLEEGRFPDRIAWLRSHYAANHPGIWGRA